MNVAAFNDSSIMKKTSYEIDGQELDIESIITSEIIWSKNLFSVSGHLIIKDNIDSSNFFPLNSENQLMIYGEDNFDDFFFKKFWLTSANEVRASDRHKGLHFEFVDVLTYKMMNTFVGKSYSNKRLSDVIKDYFDKYKWKDLLDPHVELILPKTEKVHDFITVPQDRSFVEFIKAELEKEGCTMYQTRKKIVIGESKKELTPDKQPKMEHSFSQLHDLAEHPFRIHEHISNFNPIGKLASDSPLADMVNFDFVTKTMKSNISTFEDVFDTMKTATRAMDNIQQTIGQKVGAITSRAIDTIETKAQDALMQNNALSVIITGNFKHSHIYQIADVVLSGNLENKQGQNEGDVTSSGLHSIVGVTDKFLNGKLIQKVDFERANVQKNEGI